MDILMIVLIILLIVVVVLVAAGLIKHLVKGARPTIKGSFKRLGTLRGKSMTTIVKACGQPAKIELAKDRHGNELKICVWTEPGYSITLLFNSSDLCLGVSSEKEE